MKKKSSPPRIPPLPLRALMDVQEVEEHLRASLSASSDQANMLGQINAEQVRRALDACVVEALDVQLKYYGSLPNYCPEWASLLAARTINSAIASFPRFTDGEAFRLEVERTVRDHLARREETAELAAQPPKQIGRQELRDSYFASFPDEKIKIRDVCWAAQQHVREWRRWLAGELKDGSTPDLAFRRVLTSGKRPAELQKRPRKPGWE